ncbi:MAG: hypothetical protein KGM97_00890 [Alphaproteobacteria bacterium]|nr:hypothetical protein [Alphaproteobacteria bacterium]MDE2629519.1 hypothetical protein [Alphaproteobacteria bacterium]
MTAGGGENFAHGGLAFGVKLRSSRWAPPHEIKQAGLFRAAGVFLGQLGGEYLIDIERVFSSIDFRGNRFLSRFSP